MAMYLAKQLTPRSLPEIGKRFGGRDHTTVMHAVRQIERLTAEDRTIADDLEHAEAQAAGLTPRAARARKLSALRAQFC